MKKFLVLILVCCTLFCCFGCSNTDDDKKDNYYIGEILTYEKIDITINSLSEKMISSGEHAGHYQLSVFVSMTNNKSKDFNFDFSDTYIKTENKGQKYEVSYGFDYLLGDVIISGASKEYEIHFYTPYSFKDTNFIIVFDWGILSAEAEYYLYMRDGTKYQGTTDKNNDDEEYRETVINMRDDIYDIFQQYVYNQITEDMTYSNVQKLVDSAERQVKTQITTLNIYLDLSNGTYYPKWIAQVTTNNSKTYSLFYIEVELSTSFKCTHKYMGKYEIN